MDVNSLIAQAKASTENEDQTKDDSPDFDNGPAPVGYTPARFVGYVEVGKRHQKPFQGKEKPDCQEVRLYFELNGPKHRREVEVEGVKKTFTNMISIKLAKKTGEKASFAKLLRKMTYGRDSIKHMAQMLGEAFLIQIVHNTVAKTADKPERVYANMRDAEGTFLIQAPSVTDPITNETKPLAVNEPTQPIKLLLWEHPSQEQWDSLFIDGSRTVKDPKTGVETEQSKNWLQEDIVTGAVDFEGSALQALLGGLGDLNLDPQDEVIEAPEEKPAPKAEPAADPLAGKDAGAALESKPVEKPVEEPKQTKQDVTGTPAANPADIMADLGL